MGTVKSPRDHLNIDVFADDIDLTEVVSVQCGGKNGKERTLNIPRVHVFKLAQLGATDVEIADFIGLSRPTLNAHFKHELTIGRATLRMRLRKSLINGALAEKPTPALIIFAAKNFLGMSDDGLKEPLNSDEINHWVIKPPVITKPATMTQSEREELDLDETDE